MESKRESVQEALDRAIASGKPVTFVVRLASGLTYETRGVVTGWYNGRDGKRRVGLLVGMQTQQAVALDTIEQVLDE
jgi:hypothetical protein